MQKQACSGKGQSHKYSFSAKASAREQGVKNMYTEYEQCISFCLWVMN